LHDVIIIGSGPAGLTAALYAGRGNLDVMVIGGYQSGGQLMLTTDVENFPGFPDGILGPQLMELMRKQAERFGAKVIDQEAEAVNFTSPPFKVSTHEKTYEGRTVIIATGASAKWLGLPSEEKLRGRGVSSCATCLPTGSTIVANAAPVVIEGVEEGQRVFADDGTFRRVIGRGSRAYSGDLIRIIPRYFQEEATLLTPEHPVLAATLVKGVGANYWNWTWRRPEWVPAGGLTPRHILLYPIVSETRDVHTLRLSEFLGLPRDVFGRVHFARETATSRRLIDDLPVDGDFMRLAGYFLSRGTITNRGINFSLGPKDDAHVADVVRTIERLFGYRAVVRREGAVHRIECYAGILRELFLKLFGKYSYGRSVPHWFLYLPPEKQGELLKGYWRGDGGTQSLGFVLVTNSPKLVTQLKMMLLRLGVIPAVRRRFAGRLNRTRSVIEGREVRFKHDRFELEIGGAWLKRACEIFGVEHTLLSRRTRSHAYAWIRDGYAYLPIFDLTRVTYSGTVHNIAVAGRHSYVTPGATVHNCDGAFFRGQRVVVVGGGDTAMEESLYLSKLARSVEVIHRRDALRASKIMQERAFNTPNISFRWGSVVKEILGGNKVEGVLVEDVRRNEVEKVPAEGVFIAIGHEPNTRIFKGKVNMDARGYIQVHRMVRTSVPGVFAAGDVHDHHYRQAVTAAGFGCMAAMDAEKFLNGGGPGEW
jgi:thioredoxin reductase